MSTSVGMDPLHGDVHGSGARSSTLIIAGGVATSLVALVLLFLPSFTSTAVTLITGICLMIGGGLLAVTAVATRDRGGMWTGLILGVVLLAAGLFLSTNLAEGTLALTTIAILWLLVDGVIGAVIAISRRPAGWGAMLFVSALAIILGALLWADLPSSSTWVLGIYAGLVLMGRGLTLVAGGMQLRELGE